MVKWLSPLVIVILIAVVIAAGCVDEENPNPVLPAADAVLPGQVQMNIGNVIGDSIPRGTIDTIIFTVGLVPGEKSVNVENISIVHADAIRTESLVPVEGFYGDHPQGSWEILEVQNEVGSPNNRLEFEERLVIHINPKAPLIPLQLITTIVKPTSGTSLIIRRVFPPPIIKENNLLTDV